MHGISDVGLDQEKALDLLDGIYSTVVIRDILEKAVISAESFNSEKNHTPAVQSFEYKDGKLDALYKMGDDCLLWSEHEPNLYKLRSCPQRLKAFQGTRREPVLQKCSLLFR